MSSLEGKPSKNKASRQQVISNTPVNWEQEHERQQIFQLIDSLLSFEACLYYQIIPFRLEDKHLLLGIVYPQDTGALDYVSRILSYISCTMTTQEVATDTHRMILSAYLNYKNTFRPDATQINQLKANLTLEKKANSIAENLIHSATSLSKQNQQPQSTVAQIQTPQYSQQTAEKEENYLDIASPNQLSVLQLQVPELFNPIETLPTLPAKKLLEELLGRVLSGGIGRLYLERQPYEGRILWSDNGVLQSVLENLPLFVFQGVLNELKRFAALPVTRFTEPKQVEQECLYQQNRLLLRLRVMPGMYGEEATLQVLRGAALKFYQQQQLAGLSRDALGISQQLSLKLRELHQRFLLNPNPKSEQIEAFATLNQLVDNLDQQIKIVTANNQSSIDIE
ncbi:pilus assembly protein PilB [Halotia branconii]|uniref:Pilus assembly protein PilB n=1 Tax=Halotia branconii CENA392 TaxID=1539056 RepID=A0AAJ6PAX3_9CYAN|nr:pilus assembly protein PilB [Halotia branconii]WGV27240.1 pilus assembly protein PilB [Halotia branconii CENA392]